jgi:hypothetical protein
MGVLFCGQIIGSPTKHVVQLVCELCGLLPRTRADGQRVDRFDFRSRPPAMRSHARYRVWCITEPIPQSGAHFLMRFDTPPDRLPQSMMSTLSIASSSDSCSAAVDTYVNINLGDGRSIDGYLCKLRVTWERR